MPLSTIVRQLGSTHAAAQAAYQQSVSNTSQLMLGIASSGLPVLNKPPSNWDCFVTNFEAAKAEAQSWFENVGISLLDVPGEVATYNTSIAALLRALGDEATKLRANPYDSTQLAVFNANLDALRSALSLVETFISGCTSRVERFNDQLPQLVVTLQTLTAEFSAQAGADQATVDKLQQSINALNADVAALAAQIAAEAIALDAALVVARLSPGWNPAGLVLKLLAAATVGALSYVISLNTAQIASDVAAVKAAGDALSLESADVAACQLQANTFSTFSSGVTGLQSDLQEVLQAWQQFQSEINGAITDAAQAATDSTSEDFDAVINELNAAAAEWNDVYSHSGTLQVTLNVNSAVLQYGMSSDQVQQALAAGTTSRIQDFIAGMSSAA